MSIRPQIRRIAQSNLPAALVAEQGRKLMYALSVGKDVLIDWAHKGVYARFPERATPTAYNALGRDRRILRGFDESGPAYVARLLRWLDSWRLAGHAYAVLDQLAGYLSPHACKLRIVTDSGVWYTRDPSAEVSFDAATAPIVEGQFVLPSFMSISCPTAERSAQQSATTVRTGYGAHAARAFSRDGASFGLLVEPQAENLIDNQDLSTWTASGTPVLSAATTPAGTVETVEVQDDDGAGLERLSEAGAAIVAATYTASVWRDKLDAAGVTTSLQQVAGGAFFSPSINIDTTVVDGGWVFATSTSVNNTQTGALDTRIIPATSGTGAARFWGMQLEQRGYGTSLIGADNATFTRAPDVLRVEPEAIAPDGYFELTIKFRPHYAHDEAASDHNLVYFDANNRIYYDATFRAFNLVLDGQATDIAPVDFGSFARHTELTLTVRHQPGGDTWMRLEGAATPDTGKVIWPHAEAPAVPLPVDAYLMGGPGGAEEGADLRLFDAHQTYKQRYWHKSSPDNWDWDGNAEWWRFWVIIYPPASVWTRKAWGAFDWGEPGASWGSTATQDQSADIKQLVETWKPAHAECQYVIVCFDPSAFDPEAAPGAPLPDGTWANARKPGSNPAVFSRHADSLYWRCTQ